MPSTRSRRRPTVNSAINAVATTPGADPEPSSSPTTTAPTPITIPSPAPSVIRSIRTVDDLAAEALTDKLPTLTATTETEFMTWAYQAISHFTRTQGFQEEMLYHPRDSIDFSNVAPERVDFIYHYVWLRLTTVANHVPGIIHQLRGIPLYDVRALWRTIMDKYVPWTQIELIEKSTQFQNLFQDTTSIREFTDKVLVQRDLLEFLGVTKNDDDVKTVILTGLRDSDSRAYAFTLFQQPLDRFIIEINKYDVLLAIKSRSRDSSVASSSMTATSSTTTSTSAPTPSALVTESSATHRGLRRQPQCWHCNTMGHVYRDCPEINIPRDEIQDNKRSRYEPRAPAPFQYRGRGRFVNNYRGNRDGRGNSYRGRRRGQPLGNPNPTGSRNVTVMRTPPPPTNNDERVEMALVDAPLTPSFDQLAAGFDWSSL